MPSAFEAPVASSNTVYWAHVFSPPLFMALTCWHADQTLTSNIQKYGSHQPEHHQLFRNEIFILLAENPLFCLCVL